MVVIPCSMGTLARIANGIASQLIERAADVCLKEKRPLVLCVRETPLNKIHIRNMYRAADAGATVYPLIPAFYFRSGQLRCHGPRIRLPRAGPHRPAATGCLSLERLTDLANTEIRLPDGYFQCRKAGEKQVDSCGP